jgi:hypothetical protein
MAEEKKLYLIKSPTHPWRVWKTYNPEPMAEHLRFRDAMNNYPISVPPTTGDRMDYTSDGSSIKGYTYKADGWVIIIRNGSIYQTVSSYATFTYEKTFKEKSKDILNRVKSFLKIKK